MSGTDERSYEERHAEAVDALDKAIRDVVRLRSEEHLSDDPPYVQGWVVGLEWTNVDYEQSNRAGLTAITPPGQMLSISGGLGAWLKRRFL